MGGGFVVSFLMVLGLSFGGGEFLGGFRGEIRDFALGGVVGEGIGGCLGFGVGI